MTDETARARWWPEPPPHLPGEGDDAYTDRLTGADRTGRVPYDHKRNRQCSIGWHGECSDPAGASCECPCHTAVGKLEKQVHELEESLVAAAGLVTGRLSARSEGWPERLRQGVVNEAEEIAARRPDLAEWYLSGGGTK